MNALGGWLLIFMCCCLFVEALSRMNAFAKVGLMRTRLERARHVLLSARISDHWKEKALLAYAFGILRSTGGISLTIGISVLPFVLLSLVFPHIGSGLSAKVLFTIKGLLFCTVFSIGYKLLRDRLVREKI